MNSPVTLTGTAPLSPLATFQLTVQNADNSLNCVRNYSFHTYGSGSGWGDPHITTVDGVAYDFQSAGEVTALRGDGLEIQTRQTPVATTYLPGANSYTGLATCVSTYSAVAARVGKHRVSYEPNINGVPDPSGLQLRVDGVLTTLGPGGIDLGAGGPNIRSPNRGAISKAPAGGRIVQTPIGGGIEIDYSDGTQLVVTPAWWPDQQKWYLNVNVYGTTATEGIYGKLAQYSWLPALPGGTSLGPKPDSLHQRYVDLYAKFADAWRVTDATTLFDYAPGTSTATFTLAGWPRENPQSCAIEGQPSAGPPVEVGVAQRSCSAITDNNMKADCVFDVSVTGYTGFAQTYRFTQQLDPEATQTSVKADKDPSRHGESVAFTATVAQKVSRGGAAPAGAARFILDGSQIGNPITLDPNGRALWNTSSLQVGQHRIVAKYIPSGWGSLFLASTSPQVSHTVIAPAENLPPAPGTYAASLTVIETKPSPGKECPDKTGVSLSGIVDYPGISGTTIEFRNTITAPRPSPGPYAVVSHQVLHIQSGIGTRTPSGSLRNAIQGINVPPGGSDIPNGFFDARIKFIDPNSFALVIDETYPGTCFERYIASLVRIK